MAETDLDEIERVVRELVTRIEFGRGQFHLGFLFCEELWLLKSIEEQVLARAAKVVESFKYRSFSAFDVDSTLAALLGERREEDFHVFELHDLSEGELKQILVVLNERRTSLIDRIGGLLVLSMRNSLMGEIGFLVPDLWSVRSFATKVAATQQWPPQILPIGPRVIELGGVASVSVSASATLDKRKLLLLASHALRDGKPVQAIRLAREASAIATETGDWAALGAAADVLDDCLDYRYAADAYKNALTKAPGDVNVARWARKRAENLIAIGDFQEAALSIEQARQATAVLVADDRERLLTEVTLGELELWRGGNLFERHLRRVARKAKPLSAAEVRALTALAYAALRSDLALASVRLAEAIAGSGLRIVRYGATPARVLRHAGLLAAQTWIAQIRNDDDQQSAVTYLDWAMKELGRFPALSNYRERLSEFASRDAFNRANPSAIDTRGT